MSETETAPLTKFEVPKGYALISEKDYHKVKAIVNSTAQKEIDCLEDDVDLPFKKIVGMLNLLGLKTTWSCCGFNYREQPIYKDHTMGYMYVMFKATPRALKILTNIFQSKNITLVSFWKATLSGIDNVPYFTLNATIRRGDNWSEPSSVHFHELGATMINALEIALMEMKDMMLDEVTLYDTNTEYKSKFPNWQYPGRKPWTIKKTTILGE